ncbi:hypothetical protein M433DRAFT_28316 [Acidomyces richmondensis BFW]|nr:hypothetical protein M433DRAFT_28316 [Acidomyces richmondensis BFW]
MRDMDKQTVCWLVGRKRKRYAARRGVCLEQSCEAWSATARRQTVVTRRVSKPGACPRGRMRMPEQTGSWA